MGVNPTERSSSWFHDSTGVFYSTKISENSGSKLNGTESFRKLVSKILVNLSRLSFLPKFGNSGIFLFHLAFLPGMNRPSSSNGEKMAASRHLFELFSNWLSSTKTFGSAFLENCGLAVRNFLWAFNRVCIISREKSSQVS